MIILLVIEDINISKDNIETIFGVLKFIDENFAEISKVAQNAAKVFLGQGKRALQQQQEEEPEQDEVTEYLNCLSKTMKR